MSRQIRLGALAWVCGPALFFVVHLIVQVKWPTSYSWSKNNVSDLGTAVPGSPAD